MYIFLHETELILQRGGYPLIYIDTLSSLSCDQTFNETSVTRKTLHSSNRFLKSKRVRSTNLVTGSMVLYLTDTAVELMLFELAGWTNFGYGLNYPDYISNIPEYFNIFLKNTEGSYILRDCAITTIDISLNKTFAGGITVGFEASSMDKITIPMQDGSVKYNKIQGAHRPVTPITAIFGHGFTQNVTSVGVTFSRELSPLTEATIHNSESIIQNKKRVITDSNIDITVQCYNNGVPVADYDNFLVKQGGIEISLDNAIITQRESVGDVFISSYDISPTDKTANINIRY